MGIGRLYLARRLARGRRFGALLALAFAVCAAPLPPLFDLPPAVEASLDRELQAMGPAILVEPRQAALGAPGAPSGSGGLLPENLTGALLALPEAAEVERALPVLAGGAQFAGALRPLLGLDASQVADVLPWWSAQGAGAWGNASQAWAGRKLAAAEGLRVGGAFAVAGPGGAPATFTVTALLETGGAEEDALVVPLAAAQALLGLEGRVSFVLLRVSDLDRVGTVAAAIDAAFPFLEARTVLKLVEGREQLLSTFRVLALAVAISSCAAGALTAVSVGAISLRTRVQELAVLRALGGTRRALVAYLGAEVAALGAAGAAAGYAAGLVLAGALGPALFDVPTSPSAASAGAAAAVALGVGLLMLHGITRAALRGELTEVLKDE